MRSKDAMAYVGKDVVKYAWINGQRNANLVPPLGVPLTVGDGSLGTWKIGDGSNGRHLLEPQLPALIRAPHAFQQKRAVDGLFCSTSRNGKLGDNSWPEGLVSNQIASGCAGRCCSRVYRHSTEVYRSPTRFMHDSMTTKHESKSAARRVALRSRNTEAGSQ